MKQIVSEIHVICHSKKNVSGETATHFVSGWWKIKKEHIRTGVKFALHEHKNAQSYMQGELEDTNEEPDNGKIAVRVRKFNDGIPWFGEGAGILGYRYQTDTPPPNGEKYLEGACGQVTKNYYERDPKARAACLKFYGVSCVICSVNFKDRYGEIGDGFIHVHHLEQLAGGGQKMIDPVKDLRPVCPNCHAMLHSGDRLLTPDELQSMMKR